MRIPLDRCNTTPLYRQLQNYLRKQILAGQLLSGTRLPATRKLAKDLGISRITVQNAYADLESEGLIASQEGSGTYVLAPIEIPDIIKKDYRLTWPLWQQNLLRDNPSLIRSKSSRIFASDLISFTGVGDSHHFPIQDFYKALRTVIKRDDAEALEYGELGAGYPPLRQTIAHVLASQAIQAQPENVLITTGSQQALALTCQLLLKPQDVVIVEKPTYNYALDLFQTLDLKIIGVPVDSEGMQVELLESLLQQYQPRLLYTIPNFQNPSGTCLSGIRRRTLIELAGRYNLPILEDDFAGDLRYEGRAQPAVKALDPNGRVLYTGTFSKMLMPGLRVGYLVADGPIFNHLVQAKQVNDLTTSTLIQRTLHEYVTVGRYQTHLRRSTRQNRKRRDAILTAIKHYLPEDVRVAPPQGGIFVWLRLPKRMVAEDLLKLALKNGVEFTPGERFFPNPTEGKHYLRLNFATQPPENIDKGIRRLGVAMRQIKANINDKL
jgi:GntR family transcriptional regulator/MocR family aminotransferase